MTSQVIVAVSILSEQISINSYSVYVSSVYLHNYRAIYCGGREGEIRLAGGPSSREGRVDICLDTGTRHVKTPGGFKRHWSFVSKEVRWHDNLVVEFIRTLLD